jgi:hypothetical protein
MTTTSADATRRTGFLITGMLAAVTVAVTAWPAMVGIAIALTLWFGPQSWVYTVFGALGVLGAIVGSAAAASIVAVMLLRPPHTHRATELAAVFGGLAGAAPVSFVMFLLLDRSSCVWINAFGMPWPAPLAVVGQVIAVSVVCGALVLFVACLVVYSTRFVALSAFGWWVASLIPSVLLYYFPFIYGDPVTPCVAR